MFLTQRNNVNGVRNPDLIITHCTHVLKSHTTPRENVHLLCVNYYKCILFRLVEQSKINGQLL